MKNRQKLRLKFYRRRAYYAQDGICYWCWQKMPPPDTGNPLDDDYTTAEHLQPLSEGGLTTPWNIVAAHRLCNNTRRSGWGGITSSDSNTRKDNG